MENAMTATVKPETITKDLNKLWVDLARHEPAGVLRACAMTLIVVADESDDAAAVTENLAALMHEHPSRSILIRVRAETQEHLEARVFAQCWLPFGRHQQICCEQIEITSSLQSLQDVPALVRSLVAPDLPVVVFCPSENLWWLREFEQLVPLADKLVLDSHEMADSTRVLGYLDALAERTSLRRADLAWSRLTPWRESVAQLFEEPERRRRLRDVSEVSITFNGNEASSAVHYVAAWVRLTLGEETNVSIERTDGPAFCSIARIAFKAADFEASVEMIAPHTVRMRVNAECQQVTVYPPGTGYGALSEELAISERDRVFEDVVAIAAKSFKPGGRVQ
jgi:glucose-6-phosphate dehydrogenase assembly protein OpcA